MNHSSAAHPHASYTDVLKKELFDTCAGVTLPYRGQRVYYFPQGHIEQLGGPMDVGKELLFELPPKILCEVNNVKYMAERETDQISVEITLFPLTTQGEVPSPNPQFLATEMSAVRSFCRTLTASDISKHGTLFINMCDAKNFLPPLEMSQEEEPHQYLVATDLQGKDWRFKHVFKGTPKRHLLTQGWKEFAKSKKLAIGDVLVFLRGESGDLLVGLKKLMKQDTDGKLPVISSENMCIGVLAGAHSAINYGTRFSFIYKPRPKKCEFMVDVNKYLKAQNYNLSIGTRFSMKFEAEEVMEQSFTGSIVGFHDNASSRWAGSEWRYIKVQWDKPSTFFPERVSPWELELTSNSQMSQRSKRAQPNNTVDFTQYVPCQRRKTDGQLKESCSHVYEKESNYGVEEKDYVDASEANKEGEIQVSESDIVSLQKSSDPAETNICDDIECLFRESDYIDACEFPWAESPPSLHHEAIALPSTEFENLPLAARTPTSSLGVLYSECAVFPSCKTNGILPTECENSLPLLPQVASTSHGDMTETSYMHCFKGDFHGFQVWHHLIPYLGWFSVKMGDFWNDARIQRADTVSSVLNGLGEALCLKDRNWESLNRDELEKLINGINDSLIAGFKLDCLKPIALKAEGVLKAREQCDSLQSRRSSLESQLRELDSERQNVVGELQNRRQELRSLTEGFVYQSML